MRLDSYLVVTGQFSGREKAKTAIKSGEVLINGCAVTKPAFEVTDADRVEVTGTPLPFVGRGGLKLQKAIEMFNLGIEGCCAVDLGASTGGFTDCLLQHNVQKVYAVDVGTNQLAEKLRNHPRVVVREKTNARELTASDFSEAVQLVTADLSFISLTLILPAISAILVPGGYAVCLIKPQFEAGKGNVGKNGLVKDARIHCRVIKDIMQKALEIGLFPQALTDSPITGGDGNIEFLILLRKDEVFNDDINAEQIVLKAHQNHRMDKEVGE